MDSRAAPRFTGYGEMSEAYHDYDWSPVPESDNQQDYSHERSYPPPPPPDNLQLYHDGPGNPFDDPFFKNFLKGSLSYFYKLFIIGRLRSISSPRAKTEPTISNNNNNSQAIRYQGPAWGRSASEHQTKETSRCCPTEKTTTTSSGQTKTKFRFGEEEERREKQIIRKNQRIVADDIKSLVSIITNEVGKKRHRPYLIKLKNILYSIEIYLI